MTAVREFHAAFNWLGQSDDPSTGDEAADRFIAALADLFRVDRTVRSQQYRIDRVVRRARYSASTNERYFF